MNTASVVQAPTPRLTASITWPTGIACAVLAVLAFHAAYASGAGGAHRLLIVAYAAFLIQLARLKTTRQSFYFGLATGILCLAPQLAFFWNIFKAAAVPLWIILSLWIAGFTALSHLVLRHFGLKWAVLLIPFLWTGFEYFRSELYYLRFSWMNIGYAFSDWQIFPLRTFGVYGVGLLIALCGTLFLIKPRLIGIGGSALLIGGSALLAPEPSGGGPRVTVAGVQLEFATDTEILAALDRTLARHPGTELLVLSEYTFDGPVPDLVNDWCRANARHLIVGAKDPAPDGNFYNTAFVIDPKGEVVFRQVKSVPIQFFKDGLPAPQQTLWNSPWGKIGICICYDLSYSRVIDRLVAQGAQLLIVPTMDVVDWGKRQHELHGLVAPVRAAEHGVPIFRLASSGISQAVNPDGRIVATAGFPGPGEILIAEMALVEGGTLPLDRTLAPLSVMLTAGVLLILSYQAVLMNRKTNPRRGMSVGQSTISQPETIHG